MARPRAALRAWPDGRRHMSEARPHAGENAAKEAPATSASLCGCDAPKGGCALATACSNSGMPCVFRRIIPLTNFGRKASPAPYKEQGQRSFAW
jgi:hypothetical protein